MSVGNIHLLIAPSRNLLTLYQRSARYEAKAVAIPISTSVTIFKVPTTSISARVKYY